MGSAVALTLLVTAPIVSQTVGTIAFPTNVRADTVSDSNTDGTADPAVANLLTLFQSQFDNRYISDSSRIVDALDALSDYPLIMFSYFDPNQPASMHDLQHDPQVRKLMDQSKLQSDNLFESNEIPKSKYPDLYGYFTIKDKDGDYQPMTNHDQMTQFTSNIKTMMPIEITVHIIHKSSYSTNSLAGISADLTSFTFTTGLNTFDIENVDKPNVSAGTSLPSLSNESKNKLEITDNFSNDQDSRDNTDPSSTPQYGKNIYKSVKGAINSDTSDIATDALDSDKLVMPGKYYQPITYDLGVSAGSSLETTKDKALFNFLNNLKDGVTSQPVLYTVRKIDGSKADETKMSTNTELLTENNDYKLDKTAKTLTVTREIDVTGNVDSNIDSITVPANTSSDDKLLSDTSKDTLKYKDTTLASNPDTDGVYYDFDPIANTANAKSVTDALKTPGKYYRLLTFDLGKNDPSLYNFGKKGTYKVDGSKVSYVQEVNVKAPKDATADIVNDLTVNADTKSDDKTLTDTSKDTLKDGTTVLLSNPIPEDKYYNADPSKNITATVVSDALNTPGTYYRKLTFPLSDNISTNNYNFDGEINDGKTVSYYQKVVVTPKSSTNTNTNTHSNTSHHSSSHNHNWTTSDINGVVTTKKDQPDYTLNNDDDKIVDNRALAPNTSWKTDRIRTDQYDNQQYRVASGEWINANYVVYNKLADSSTGLSGIQSTSGILYVDYTKDYYRLYNKDDKLVNNRALAKNTYWQVDKIAKDNNGNTYYRVATNEWVEQETGVHYPVSENYVK